MFEILGVSDLQLYGFCLILIGVCGILIKTSRFTKTKDIITGITVIKDKQSGKEYIQHKGGNVTELK